MDTGQLLNLGIKTDLQQLLVDLVEPIAMTSVFSSFSFKKFGDLSHSHSSIQWLRRFGGVVQPCVNMSHSILVSRLALSPSPPLNLRRSQCELSLLDLAAVSELQFCLSCSSHRNCGCVWHGGYELSEHIGTATNLLKRMLMVFAVFEMVTLALTALCGLPVL